MVGETDEPGVETRASSLRVMMDRDDLLPLIDLLRGEPIAVLTGAGLSAASGLPTYRGAEGEWLHAKPIQHQEFLRSAAVRRRYWARSYVGWETLGRAEPNLGHRALAALEQRGSVSAIITQNVDGLHQKAGAAAVIELHGTINRVCCLACHGAFPRALVQEWLRGSNPVLPIADAPAIQRAPDGDAHLDEALHAAFRAPECPACGGVLKPDVVFYGDGVPRERVAAAMRAVEQSAALLVVGSSLMVYSGFRFARHAHSMGKPLVAINRGITRADALLSAKIDADCCDALKLAADDFDAARKRSIC